MIQSKVEILHTEGLHARPASIFVQAACRFQSEVRLKSGDTTVNAKSIMGVMMLALSPGSIATLEVDGVDEKQALENLSEILTGNFSEN